MCLVSPVSQQLLDRCEIEKNPISLQAAQALEDEYPNCSTQIYYSLALITKGSAKTLVHSVEATHGAEACAPVTPTIPHATLEPLETTHRTRNTQRNGSGLSSKGREKGQRKTSTVESPSQKCGYKHVSPLRHPRTLGKGLPKARRSSV